MMDSPRMITLTVRSTAAESLADLLAHLRSSFRRLRARAAWRAHVVGGIYTVEATHSPRTGAWHPHVHIIADGRYWNVQALQAEWNAASGDSYIVDIRPIRSKRGVARYVAKYVAKAADFAAWSDSVIEEYAEAMHGARLVHTLGNLHGRRLDADAGETIDGAEVARVPIGYLAAVAASGAPRAERLVRRLADHSALLARALGRPHRPGLASLTDAGHRRRRESRLAAVCRSIAADVDVLLPRRPVFHVEHEADFAVQGWLDWPEPPPTWYEVPPTSDTS